jgi:hypothetical protein
MRRSFSPLPGRTAGRSASGQGSSCPTRRADRPASPRSGGRHLPTSDWTGHSSKARQQLRCAGEAGARMARRRPGREKTASARKLAWHSLTAARQVPRPRRNTGSSPLGPHRIRPTNPDAPGAADGGDQEQELVPVRRGVWLSTVRSRRGALVTERVEQLNSLGIHWTKHWKVTQADVESSARRAAS